MYFGVPLCSDYQTVNNVSGGEDEHDPAPLAWKKISASTFKLFTLAAKEYIQ